jgi:hypothetical protein
MAQSILSKADITNYAPELDLSSYSDATISGMLSQATNRAVQFCSVKGFDYTTETDEQDRAYISNDGELQISVRRRPIVSVSAISLVKGGFSTNLVLTDTATPANPLYQIPTPGNKLVFPNSYFYLTGTYLAGGSSQLYTLRGAKVNYKITYVGGYQNIPDDLKYACMLYFRDQYAKRNNPSGLSSFTQGSYSETNSSNKGKSSLVLEAEDVLMNGGYARTEW